MQDLKILNTRQRKEIYKFLEKQFGYEGKIDAVFLESPKGKIYLLSKDYEYLELKGLRVNNKGMYFVKREAGGFRLSIEGTQVIKPKKNIIDLTKEETHMWMMGEDIPKEGSVGYVIVRYKKDILGCTIQKDDNIRNMVAKERRLHSITE